MGATIFPTDQSCYRRQYDRAHLASHPDQRVTEIAVGAVARDARVVVVNLSLMRRGDREVYLASAYCESRLDHLSCLMEGDAGAFDLSPAKGGKLLLTVATRGMAFEGARDFVEISGLTGDDRSFLLAGAAPGACP
ncbi:MAG: hypothetical protein R3D63_14080 [Paracoccaceae bacterium]